MSPEAQPGAPRRPAVVSGGRTTVVEIAGASMLPALPPGTRILVAHGHNPRPVPGQIVLIAGTPPIVHRVVHVARSRDRHLIFHRGDAMGAMGIVGATAVAGVALAVLSPNPGAIPTVDTLPGSLQRGFRRSRRRARLLALALALGLRRSRLPAWLQRRLDQVIRL